MGFDRSKLIDKLDNHKIAEFFYGTIVEAMEEVELELVKDEEYEKAILIRDEVKKLKDEYNALHSV